MIAIEPESTTFRLLVKNIKVNGCSNTVAIRTAVGNEHGTMKLNVYEKRGHNSFVARPKDKLERVEKVPLDTLDHVLEEERVEKVDFLKIDVEGAELEVLLGAQNALLTLKPKVVLETHDWGPSVVEITNLLHAFSYSAKFVPTNLGLGLIFAAPLAG